MYTQNTPVHVRLWHKDFWLLVLADMFVSMAMYVQLPLLPQWMVDVLGCQPSHAAAALGVSGLGLFALGCFCSYLVQRYRRNMVCVASLLVMAASFSAKAESIKRMVCRPLSAPPSMVIEAVLPPFQ